MTIAVQTPRSGPYSGDGATTTFAYGFLIDADSELVVVVADAAGTETVQTIVTDYTVTGAGNNAGGTVVFEAGSIPAATETVSIRRATALDQGVDLQNRGSVVPQTLEDTYDEIVKMAQDLQEQLDRAILLRVTANTTGIDVPAPDADKVLGWNSAGTNLENKTPNTGAYLTTPASVTDNRVVRFDGTTGEAFQESAVTIDDAGSISMSTIQIDNTNSRIGIGTVSPSDELHMSALTPAIQFSASGGANDNDAYWTYDGVEMYFSMDDLAAVANNKITWAIDSISRFQLQSDGKNQIGTVSGTATCTLEVNGTDAIKVPVGTTAQRPGTPEQGHIRRNTTTALWEGYDGSSWGNLGGAGLFRGNNGTSGDTVNGAGDIFRVNAATLTVDEEIESGENASAAGPLTVDSGITLTVTGTLVIV